MPRLTIPAAFAVVSLAACSGQVSPQSPRQDGAAQTVTVQVTPSQTTVAPGSTAQLAAVVSGTLNTAVTWSVVEAGDAGFVTTTGRYTAPAASTGTFHVRARSVADTTAYGDAAVIVQALTCTSFTYSAWTTCTNGQQTRTVLTSSPAGCTGGSPVVTQSCTPATVTISPKTLTLDACTSHTFTATVQNASSQAVTWSLGEANGGLVTTAGVYTAPSTAGTYHLIATSQAAGASDTATLTVVDHVLSVAVSPANVTLAPGQTVQFTATVNTSCGSVSSIQSVTAPSIAVQ